MLEFGKSYVVSLSESMITADGNSRWAVFGDYKGEAKLGEDLFLQFGDAWIKAACIRFLTRTDVANMATIQDQAITSDGEKVEYTRPSFIGRAHVRNG